MARHSGLGDGEREVTINLPGVAAPPRERWINPARDEPPREIIDQLWNPAGRVRMPTPGDNGTGANDWVLLLERR